MKSYYVRIMAIAVMALAGQGWASQEATNQQLRLHLALVDGSYVIGTPRLESVRVQTPYAKMDIPLREILKIKIADDHEKATFNLRNGDRLQGVVGLEPIKLETLFGRVSVGDEHIRTIGVVLSGGALPDSLRHGLVLHYSFDQDGVGKVMDSSEKNNDGVVHGAKWTPNGKVGAAYDFDGNGDYIDTGCNFSGMDEISVCGWVRPIRGQRGSSVVTQFGGPASDNVWGLFAQNDNGNDLVPPHQRKKHRRQQTDNDCLW